jgi:hypothetical protein
MKYLSALLLSLFLIGCSAMKIAVNQQFWENNQADRIGIIFTKQPQPYAYKLGSQGLLDIAINNLMASTLQKHLEEIDISGFQAVKDTFKTHFEEKGFHNIIFLNDTLNEKQLKTFSEGGKKFADKDFRNFKQKYNIDFLIVISIAKYGTAREYYGFIPLGAPSGLFEANGMMVDLNNNKYIWYREMSDNESIKKVEGDWDQAPDYPNLTKAIMGAMNSAKKFLSDNFFYNVDKPEVTQ